MSSGASIALPARATTAAAARSRPDAGSREPSQVASPAVTTGFTELASVDGTITPTGEAMVPMKDDGLYRGDGAFEVIRLYDGKPFALVDHLDRLERSAAAIELEFDRAGAGGARSTALLDRAGAGRRAAAADRHPRRPPHRRDRADPGPRRDAHASPPSPTARR